jgi:hypothetical protein
VARPCVDPKGDIKLAGVRPGDQGRSTPVPAVPAIICSGMCTNRIPLPPSSQRGRRSRGSRAAGRRDCPTGPWETARAGPARPVPPVLSGRDQASAAPSIAFLHPLASADAREATMPIWQLHDDHLLNSTESNGQQAGCGSPSYSPARWQCLEFGNVALTRTFSPFCGLLSHSQSRPRYPLCLVIQPRSANREMSTRKSPHDCHVSPL